MKRIGVLKLVDQHMRKAPDDFVMKDGIVFERANRSVDQVPEVEGVRLPQPLLVGRVDPPDHLGPSVRSFDVFGALHFLLRAVDTPRHRLRLVALLVEPQVPEHAFDERLLILVGDAPPHPENMLSLMRKVRRFHKKGGVVTTLDVSLRSNPEVLRRVYGMEAAGPGRDFIPEYEELAVAGGGEVTNLQGTDRVARSIAVAIFGTQWREWLLPFLGGLE